MTPEPPSERAPRSPRDLSSPLTRALIGLWVREGKWSEVALSGVSMRPLIPDGSRLTVRFGRQEIVPGDVVLYASDERVIAHRVVRLGRRGPHRGWIKIKGDPVRPGEASWIRPEEILGRVVAVRRPDGSAVLLNTKAARVGNRAAAALSRLAARAEGVARSALGAPKPLRVTPALLVLLDPLYRLGGRRARQEEGLLLRAEERFLLAAARVRPSEEDDGRLRRLLRREILWERLIPAASGLGLAPLVYRNLGRAALRDHVPAAALAALGRSAHAAACRMAVQIEALQRITDALRGAGIDPILLKGAALALTIYDQPALRPMEDLDLLVGSGQVGEAMSILAGLGFHGARGRSDPAFYETHHHDRPQVGYGGRVVVEIHRGLVAPEEGVRVDAEEMAARARSVQSGGFTHRVLAREDQILHVALHLSLSDRFVGGLRDLIDMDALVRSGPRDVEWGVLLSSARSPEIARCLAATLSLASRLLGSPVPQELVNELSRAAGWDPLTARLLRLVARSSLFAGPSSEALLSDASARWICSALLRKKGWKSRLEDVARVLEAA